MKSCEDCFPKRNNQKINAEASGVFRWRNIYSTQAQQTLIWTETGFFVGRNNIIKFILLAIQ